MSRNSSTQPRLQRFILAVFLASLAMSFGFLLADFDLLVIPAMLSGWFVADLASGLVHMYMDYRPCPEGKRLNEIFFYDGSRESEEYRAMFAERMASIGPIERLVYDFKNHHPRPDALGRRSLWRLIGSTVIIAALPLSLGLNVALLLFPVPGWAVGFCLALFTGGAFAQYFHGALHRMNNPWFVEVLRKAGLLMSCEAHQLHHNTLQCRFATNCGWSNWLLDRLFRALRRRGYLSDAGLVPQS